MPTPTQAGALTKFSIGNAATTTRTITDVAAGAALTLWIAPQRFASGFTDELLTVSCPTATFVRVGHHVGVSDNAGGGFRQELSLYLATAVAAGSHTVTITAASIGGNANDTRGSWLLSEWSGIAQEAPAAVLAAPAVSNRIATGIASITVGPSLVLSQSQCMVLSGFAAQTNFLWGGTDPGTPPVGYTLLAQTTDNATPTPILLGWRDTTAADAVSATTTVVGSSANPDGTRGLLVPLRLSSGSDYVEILVTPDTEDGVTVDGTTGWTAHIATADPRNGFNVFTGLSARPSGNEIRVPNGAPGVANGGTVNAQVVNAALGYTSGWGLGTARGAAAVALTLTPGAPASITPTGFTLSATISGTIPAGAVRMIQWTDNPAGGTWRESHPPFQRPAAVAGTFSHTFSDAPPSTTITWRAFVFSEPDTIHAQTANLTFTTPAAPGDGGSAGIVATIVDHMGTHPFTLANAPARDWAFGSYVVKGADLRATAQPTWWDFNTYAGTHPMWAEIIAWFYFWDITGHQANLNARAACRNNQLWLLHDDNYQWEMISDAVTPTGSSYDRQVLGLPPATVPPGYYRTETDGSNASSVRFGPAPDLPWHGYGTWGTSRAPTRLIGVISRVQVRKILHDPAGPDQRSLARYACYVGADPSPTRQSPAALGHPYNPGVGGSRFVELTNDWQWIYFCNLGQPPTRVRIEPHRFNERQVMSTATLTTYPPPF
jgi:hypothetical protein